ncbi:hulk isoform X3 [Oratosquilla oratoria]|uniref:hulk isoform X3 n=1 Tax=Oratosquilla oratoria TaxID=337810 RepID=UPI003F75F904
MMIGGSGGGARTTITLLAGLLLVTAALLLPCPAQAKKEDVIEEVNAKQLETIIHESDYVAVYWYKKSCKDCDKVLAELETIDDDTDRFGVQFVKIADKKLAKSYGIKTFPALSFFRNKEPMHFEGDLMDEASVLEFLTSLEAMELPDQIEEVNAKILDKIVEEQTFVAVIFYKSECRKCVKVLQELENIDDDADQLGIAMVKLNDPDLADEYSLGTLPAMVYYRRRIPVVYDGDLLNEEKVLEWLVENKKTGEDDDVIDDVTSGLLNTLIDSMDHLCVVFYDRDEPDDMDILAELEDIDDDLDEEGIHMVKIDDDGSARDFGIEETPALVYFEHEIPSLYDGDLHDEQAVLAWLIQQLHSDEIEDVNDEMLDKLIQESEHLAVLFYDEKDSDNDQVLNELENIDDECDAHGISFVKISNEEEASEYGIEDLPTLVYFEKSIPSLYTGNLLMEDDVLDWLVKQAEGDDIEDVTDEMLDRLIDRSEHLAVLFYDRHQKKSKKVLAELENIDDECDAQNILFVKIDDEAEAKEYGIEEIPTLVYFESEIPYLYEGDLMKEEEVLAWLEHHVESEEIADITDEMLDKLIANEPFLAVLFYDKGDQEDHEIIGELENIDDDCEQAGIPFVKIADETEAREYGIEVLPTLVYFEDRIPSIYEGDLSNEQAVLKWLLEQKTSDTIEEVTDEILDDLVANFEYVVVYFSGACDEGEKCDKILDELENIDDDTDDHGMHFVTTEDLNVARQHGIKEFPAIVLFRNGEPLVYKGDLENEYEVLEWLTSEDTLEIPNQIEEVNGRMLEKMLNTTDNVAVFFYVEGDKKSKSILVELENIDDECDDIGINFVKISDTGIAQTYDISHLPALVYFRNRFPQIYEGDLKDEDALLEWLIDNKDKGPASIIEEVDGSMLPSLVESFDYLVVYFYDENCPTCETVLAELETIDDETDEAGIQFVKTGDVEVAEELGISHLPALVYFEGGVPSIYDGDITAEEEVLEWLIEQRHEDTIENINRQLLYSLIDTQDYLAVYFYNEENEECPKVLRVLEKIDDEAAEFGVQMVKMNDRLMAKKYGFRNPPGLVYFRKGKHIKYEGDLYDEEDVLDWLTAPENMEMTDAIEKVNRKMFERMRQSTDYLAVFFYAEEGCKQCLKVLAELENIDDEADANGIDMVKIDDPKLAKEVGVYALPAIVFYRAGVEEPIIFAGDMKNEENLLSWLLTEKDPSADFIEDLNGDVLLKVIKDSDAIAVYFWDSTTCGCEAKLSTKKKKKNEGDLEDPEMCVDCIKVLEELENIDDDTDRIGVKFVKTQDVKVAERYGVTHFPALLYFERSVPTVYEGDLLAEEDVLQWLVLQKTEDRIETINRNMLEVMLEDTQYLAVFFYKPNCRACDTVLQELENIDDECDVYGIHMVKIQDAQLAKRYGIKTLPALIYFRNGNPLIFEGEIKSGNYIYEWLSDEENRELVDEIENINTAMLDQLLSESTYLAVLFCDMQNEGSVLEWLTDDDNRELYGEIEDVNVRMLLRLMEESPFIAVLFYEDDCQDCEQVLHELENIDDEVDMFGIDFVKINDPEAAHRFNILHTPALVYFRKKIPLVYDGDLLDEDNVFSWLTSQDVFEIKDEIEEVNRKMLEKLLDENDFVAVYFYEDNNAKCDEVLDHLENIDDDTDDLDITFVKIRDSRYAKKYGIQKVPALVYFRRRFPSIFRGDLIEEDEVLEWLQKNRYKHPELNLFMYATGAITAAFVMYTLFLMFCFRGPGHHKAA